MGRLKSVMIICVAVSVAGVAYAVWQDEAAAGGRGGALAVALTFAMLFLDRDTAKDIIETDLSSAAKDDHIPVDDDNLRTYLSTMRTEQAKTRNALATILDWQNKQKWPLAVSSIFGTVCWGFGDLFAQWFGAAG